MIRIQVPEWRPRGGRRDRFALVLILLVSAVLPMRIAHGQGISQEEASQLARMELPTEPSELLAIVGSSPILVGDLLPKVDRRIAALATVDVSEIPELELKVVRLKLLRGLLTETIQTKMLGLAFVLDKVGTSASDKRDEAQQKIESQARRSFSENEIPRMMKQSEVDTILDLDTKLREQGTSLKVLEDEYKDRMLRTVFVQQLIPKEPEVTLSEIHRYYTLHTADFTVAAGARWEQLTVLFENFPSRTAALEAITAMGREAYFGGNVQSVAREKSQEPMASKGGLHNWTSQGSLRSKPLEDEIFALPLNRLSNIIEDENGFHIIRVLERRESSVKPLSEVQDEIRETIAATKLKAAEAEVLEKIRRDIPVWTRYPEDVQGAKPLEGATTISIKG